mmetsp:Transcript_3671/g.10630  ORF Transcript_3671/g.10630 Transcript_3671/m.10630 type:complete len:231 (+) Transcript_3671:789-1481(+)
MPPRPARPGRLLSARRQAARDAWRGAAEKGHASPQAHPTSHRQSPGCRTRVPCRGRGGRRGQVVPPQVQPLGCDQMHRRHCRRWGRPLSGCARCPACHRCRRDCEWWPARQRCAAVHNLMPAPSQPAHHVARPNQSGPVNWGRPSLPGRRERGYMMCGERTAGRRPDHLRSAGTPSTAAPGRVDAGRPQQVWGEWAQQAQLHPAGGETCSRRGYLAGARCLGHQHCKLRW